MLSIHNADEEFYRTEKSTQFELIAVQTYSTCELREKITSNPVGQKQTKPRRQCSPVLFPRLANSSHNSSLSSALPNFSASKIKEHSQWPVTWSSFLLFHQKQTNRKSSSCFSVELFLKITYSYFFLFLIEEDENSSSFFFITKREMNQT